MQTGTHPQLQQPFSARRRRALLWAVALVLAVGAPQQACAQSDPEYLMEIGGGVGLTGYLGDFNGKLTRDVQPAAAIVGRRLFNPWAGIRLSASWGKLKGNSADAETYYPEFRPDNLSPTRDGLPYSFSHTLVDLAAVFEYNFLPYGTGRDYRGAQPLVPYLYGGVGAALATGSGETHVAAILPLGLGIKYKVAPRLNLGIEWGIRFSTSDELDGVKDPYGIASSGLFKNTDCYHTLQLSLTYSFMAKCRTCHNADEN